MVGWTGYFLNKFLLHLRKTRYQENTQTFRQLAGIHLPLTWKQYLKEWKEDLLKCQIYLL